MKGKHLGEFEELILLACAYLKEQAYGINIVEEINVKMDRKVSLSAVHVTLYRLEDKGLVKSYMGGATAQRGGRKKRIFNLTNTGLEMLRDNQQSRLAMWDQVPELKLS